jgi:amicyanin
VEPTLANGEPTRRSTAPRWRLAALAAVSTVALAACGGAAGAGSTPTPNSPSSSVPTPAAAPGATAPQAPAAMADVGIDNFKFTPAALTVKVGTTVVWTNKDAIAHTVNFMTGAINSNVLNQNGQFSHTFATPGTYDYICSIHPFMHGSVTVTA